MVKKTYEPAPQVPEQLRSRYATMLEVLAGRLTVSEGARRLGMSRNHFQTVMHKGLKGLLEGLTPGEAGRPAKPEREAELEKANEELTRENQRLKARGEMIDRLLGVASQVVRGRVRTSRPRKTAETSGSEGDDPDGAELKMVLEAECELREAGLPPALSCLAIGASPATVRRWRRRLAAGTATEAASSRTPAAELRAQLEALVRSLHGLIGADALRIAVPGVSRRQAAAVKKATLTAMERERKAEAGAVEVTVPGVVRGFDAMHIATDAGTRYALVAADAAVPYRTSAAAVPEYDGHNVAETLERDFAVHGPPLVLRADRAKCHTTPEVLSVLREHGVLLLQGPPRHPRYYGQLERQNREHRLWLAAAGQLEDTDLDRLCEEMLLALNSAWPRRSLGWRTSEEAWEARPALCEDRAALCDEVQDRAARIRRQAGDRGATAAMAERLAIEWALTKRGYLRSEPRGGC